MNQETVQTFGELLVVLVALIVKDIMDYLTKKSAVAGIASPPAPIPTDTLGEIPQ